MEQTTKATIYGLISNLEKYTIEDAKRILFQMAQDMDRAYDTQVRDLRRKAEVFDQLDAYGCNSAGAWLDIVDENRRLKESAAAPQVGGEGIGEEALKKLVNDIFDEHLRSLEGHFSKEFITKEEASRYALAGHYSFALRYARSHGLFSPADQLVKAGEAMEQLKDLIRRLFDHAGDMLWILSDGDTKPTAFDIAHDEFEKELVGMGAVVTKDVPAGETWVGNPARKLEKK